MGAGAWFNQGCPLPAAARAALARARAARAAPPARFKYGVVSVADLVADLTTWRHLYVAGRLQKPTVRLAATPAGALAPTLAAALDANVASAAAAALLLLPPVFDDAAWRRAVAGLSYGGDVRGAVRADAPAKAAAIAAGSAAGLDAMYVPHLAGAVGAAGGVVRLAGGAWAQDPRAAARGALLAALPPRVGRAVAAASGAPAGAPEAAVAAAFAARAPRGAGASAPLARAVAAALAATVAASSARQAVLGLLTAGPVGAARYVGAKLAKGWR